MSEETTNKFKEAIREYCYAVLTTETKTSLDDERVSKEIKLKAIKKMKDYYSDNQDYEKAAVMRNIEKQIEEL